MRPARRAELVPVLALSVVTALWGSTFFLSKDLLTRLDPMDLLAVRFALATLMLLVIRPTGLLHVPKRTWLHGLALGSIYGAAQLPQYFGLRETTATASGFLIGTYVVFTPLLGLLILRTRSSWKTYLGVLLAAVGLAIFSLDGMGLGLGEVLSLSAAVLYAGHIVAMGRWSRGGDAWALTTIQMITITLVLLAPALVGGLKLPETGSDWMIIAYLGIVAGALAIGVQTWAQSRIPATHAAVIMAAEPLWAAGLAVAFTAETVNTRLVVGGSLLLAANLVIAATQESALAKTSESYRPARIFSRPTSACPSRRLLRNADVRLDSPTCCRFRMRIRVRGLDQSSTVPAMTTAEQFVPVDFDPPTSLTTDQFHLEPLGPQHNQADHAAWMSSIEHIRSTPGFPDGNWPPRSGMTLEENLADLRRHADDFARGAGFTFTVLDPDDDGVIGCVYLYPSDSPAWDVTVQSWVRADRSDLDIPLADAVARWLDTDWPWERVDRCGR